jgi:pyruvate/2-oxoglutarate/acetoin dehydrogenase E1 component
MVRKVIDIRVKMDLVILADRGGQTFEVPPAVRSQVASHVNGWFRHSDTNEPGYWDKHGLAAVVAASV